MQPSPLSPELKAAFDRPKSSVSDVQRRMAEEYWSRASAGTTLPMSTRMGLVHQALLANPFDARVLERYGWELVQMGKEVEFAGYFMLERAFSSEMDHMRSSDDAQGRSLCSMIGRYNHILHKYATARKFFLKAHRSASRQQDDINAVQLATCMTSFPTSVSDAAKQLAQFHTCMDRVLQKPQLMIPPQATYDFIILSAFNFELYYEADIRDCMHKYYLLTAKIFPSLVYEARVLSLGRRRLGIASGFFGKNNSVIADFRGVLQRLDRTRFDIVFVNVMDKVHKDEFPWPNETRVDVMNDDQNWLEQARNAIEAQSLDLLFYLDSTMSSTVQRLMMSKLARVQAVSHGHPVTTGLPRETMDYFISWGAAELPTAQEHYTEELILLDEHCMHQYYDHRIDDEGRSVITELPFRQYTRTYFETMYRIPEHKRWYACMQKPFKLHPEFDEMCLSILAKDRTGVLVLHAPDHEENQEIFNERLAAYLDRVIFVPALPHHLLMALYNLSDVILDSYYAGGCTTSREALEIGAPVVTLPGKYLGGRWTLAYYNIMGWTDLVATSKEHYVELALSVGHHHRTQILEHVHKLFHREEAVQSWTRVLDTIIAKGSMEA